jgi:hypothetical protein
MTETNRQISLNERSSIKKKSRQIGMEKRKGAPISHFSESKASPDRANISDKFLHSILVAAIAQQPQIREQARRGVATSR